MEYDVIKHFAAVFSRDYATEFIRLIVRYETISASEAASRLGIHIKTAQDFLEEMTALGMLESEEVNEGKRPYNRYRIIEREKTININLYHIAGDTDLETSQRIKERKNAPVIFNTSGNRINSLLIIEGKGRSRKERRINLTDAQSRFLFHLPFPTADSESVEQIMKKAGIDKTNEKEVMDIIEFLIKHSIIESN